MVPWRHRTANNMYQQVGPGNSEGFFFVVVFFILDILVLRCSVYSVVPVAVSLHFCYVLFCSVQKWLPWRPELDLV